MFRFWINENFIDKIFLIVVNILLWIILIILGEKRVFIYYRDGVIWFYFFIEIGKKWKKFMFVEGEICKYKGLIFFVVYFWLM